MSALRLNFDVVVGASKLEWRKFLFTVTCSRKFEFDCDICEGVCLCFPALAENIDGKFFGLALPVTL